jgi:4'-phosphopantetheinyl transferase
MTEQVVLGDAVAHRTSLAMAFDAAWPSAYVPPASPRWGVVAFATYADWRPWLDEAALVLDLAEGARAGRQRFAVHRNALVLAYALHRFVLGALLGCPPQSVPLRRDGRGRPCLADDALATSLSHADDCVAIAVGNAGCIGIDIEPVSRSAAMPEIADRIAHPTERGMLANVPEAWRRRELLDLWVRKEALLKAAGIGLAREMNSFVAPTGLARLPVLDGMEDARLVNVSMLDAGPGHVAALAADDGIHATCIWLHPR